MSNDSTTGGYLSPAGSPAPIDDTALEDILQQMVVGLTGLPGSLVRPMWQTVVPTVPEPTVNWCALGVTVTDGDANPVSTHDQDANSGQGGETLQRHETIELLCSFYGPHAQALATVLRDSLYLGQNNSAMQLYCGIGLKSADSVLGVPELINQQWQRRYDLKIRFRRQVIRSYPIYNLLSAPFQIQKG
ncbi:hypothetical protein [Chromobacterium violaceum]|uniref:phage neck terminator protein n=1 Tax=Chromobacterium violaceum TaxID=536 RepID=UPI0005BBF25B|nr:hypothetical protein [Chromobacterium violaceum]